VEPSSDSFEQVALELNTSTMVLKEVFMWNQETLFSVVVDLICLGGAWSANKRQFHRTMRQVSVVVPCEQPLSTFIRHSPVAPVVWLKILGRSTTTNHKRNAAVHCRICM
jgi:hypothetical protein